jgi:TPR repeat protein
MNHGVIIDEPKWSPKGVAAMTFMFPLALGPGTPHSLSDKVALLKISAGRDKGKSSAISWFKLGKALLNGEGTKQDLRYALECFENSADRGEPEAALEAGKLLFKGGPGFSPNHERAKELLERAALDGKVPEAKRRLAELILAGPEEGHSEVSSTFPKR